ncbi:MAG: beta-lactamase family protein [Paludibacteraceae bacterium]|nr:beta-lactamase family protein [Paludibacteraceae bacterium]
MNHKLFVPLMTAILCGASCTSSRSDYGQSNGNVPHTGHDLQDLDVYFDSITPRLMGSIMITKGDSILFSKNMGYSDLESRSPVSDTTLFKVGSISKSFTAILTLKAIEAGKLSMDDKLVKFFPDANIPNADKITVYHLLHHRSGLLDYLTDVESWEKNLEWIISPQTKAQMVQRIAKDKTTHFEPNEMFRYCNSNYLLLAYILEQIYSKTYAELIDEQIAKPIGLKNTFCSSGRSLNPKSYAYRGGWHNEEYWHPTVVLGTGSIISTNQDLQKYVYSLANGAWGKYVFSQMTDFVDGYGCGLIVDSNKSVFNFTHTGRIESFISYMKFEDGVVTTVLYNGMGINAGTIDWTMNQAIKGEEFPIPSLTVLELDSIKLNEYVGDYQCDSLILKFENDGKHLICTDANNCKSVFEAKPNDLFQCFFHDMDVSFSPTRDSIRFRKWGDWKLYVKKK